MRVTKRKVTVAAGIVAVAFVASAATLAIAGAPLSTGSGGPVSLVKAVGSVNNTSTSSTTFVNLPGASSTINVPPGTSLLIARFSGETWCDNTTADTGWCTVRILVDNKQMLPAAGTDYAFDSYTTGTGVSDNWEGHAIERFRVVGGGNHTVRVQYAVTDANVTFRLDDWTLIVERAN